MNLDKIINPQNKFSFELNQNVYVIKVLNPREESEVDVEISIHLKGQPINAIPEQTYYYLLACYTLQKAVIKKPKELENLHFLDIYDIDLVLSLWEKYLSYKNLFYENLKKNRENNFRKSERRNSNRDVSSEELFQDEYRTNHDYELHSEKNSNEVKFDDRLEQNKREILSNREVRVIKGIRTN